MTSVGSVRYPGLALLSMLLLPVGCGEVDLGAASGEEGAAGGPTVPGPAKAPTPHHTQDEVDTRPPPMHQPVPLWEGGRTEREVDAATAAHEGYLVVDIGEAWTPYIFSERDSGEQEAIPNQYRATYLALARGEFPEDHHGERARRDKYLELYGIPPTLDLIRRRFRETNSRECDADLDLSPLRAFDDFSAYRGGNFQAEQDARRFDALERDVQAVMRAQGVEAPDQIDVDALRSKQAQSQVRQYLRRAPRTLAIRAAQERLRCEGYYADRRTPFVRGAFDWSTQQALAEFERRHRIYGWGFLGGETLEMLRRTPAEGEREAVLRVLTERAIHAAGIIEDGSTSEVDGEPRTYRGADGAEHPIRNLEAEVRERVIEAFGLQTPESTFAWLEGLDELAPDQSRLVAIPGIALPEYYTYDMELSVEIDRGDVWYEFPYDETGAERAQPTSRRPRTSIILTYMEQRIPLARYGTTIGGWRTENVDGTSMWSYKNSPPGPRVWHEIVAAPVWMPPASTPASSLLVRARGGGYRINYHETGPSYASAYGLVAAYHRLYRYDDEGNFHLGGDEGIRSHGSVDYMSIMRRHSHGCHRLHNHIAVRLMSFVLAHRPHVRDGMQDIGYRLGLDHEGRHYVVELDQGGYVFRLERPVPVEVLPGRILGTQGSPIDHSLPKFNEELGAYVTPEGQAVRIDRHGNMTPIPMPPPPVAEGETPPPAGAPLGPPLPYTPVQPGAPAPPPAVIPPQSALPRPPVVPAVAR